MRLDTRAKEHGIASDRSHQISISKQLPTESDLTARSRSIQQQMDLATKGMDIVIVMDCTGSMVRCMTGSLCTTAVRMYHRWSLLPVPTVYGMQLDDASMSRCLA